MTLHARDAVQDSQHSIVVNQISGHRAETVYKIMIKDKTKMVNITGLSVYKAQELYPDIEIRVVMKDGVSFPSKLNCVYNRYNVVVENGVIIDVKGVG